MISNSLRPQLPRAILRKLRASNPSYTVGHLYVQNYKLSTHQRPTISTGRASYSSFATVESPSIIQHEVEHNFRVQDTTSASGVDRSADQPLARQPKWKAHENPLWLRDNCRCAHCVDPSTTQKNFQTSDIPLNLSFNVVEDNGKELKVTWENDLPGYGRDHVSTFSQEFLSNYEASAKDTTVEGLGSASQRHHEIYWDKATMAEAIQFVDYEEYRSSEEAVFKVLRALKEYGLVFLRGVPTNEKAVETVAERIGHIKDTFYGRTWDVKSVAQAKNVAYTSQYLGFHMDLLYKSDPPGLQLLHCIKNSCTGGSSMFSDAFHAADQVRQKDVEEFNTLRTYNQTFHYDNAGEHYRYTRPTVITNANDPAEIEFVNWSPPFQGPVKSAEQSSAGTFADYVKATKSFSTVVEAPESIYEYRMQEGDCVIFNNRRALHARREFDTTSGERWLKGTYVDTDVFMSRYRVLFNKYGTSC